jgi:hypothetical protein
MFQGLQPIKLYKAAAAKFTLRRTRKSANPCKNNRDELHRGAACA